MPSPVSLQCIYSHECLCRDAFHLPRYGHPSMLKCRKYSFLIWTVIDLHYTSLVELSAFFLCSLFLFGVVLGLCCCGWLSLVTGEPWRVVVLARALGTWASAVATQVLVVGGLWNLPGPGMEPSPLHWQAASYPLYHQGSLELLY